MGSSASDAKRITKNFPELYVISNSCTDNDPLIDELCLIVEKQIQWKISSYKNGDRKYYDATKRSSKREPCTQQDIDFITDKFFTVCPYRPQASEYKIKCKDWIHVTYHLFDLFEEYSPFKLTHTIQHKWINEIFICASHLSYDMDLYCCQLIDIMTKCWGIKTFTKYTFHEELVELKSFYVLNHCANKKQYLRSFKTTPKTIKTYVYQMIENISHDPVKNRGNICMKLIEFFMNKKRLRSVAKPNHNKSAKLKLTYLHILKHVMGRIRALNRNKNEEIHNKYHKYHKYSDYVKVETVISELNVLLSKLKQYIIQHKLLERPAFDQIIHNEILSLVSNANSNAKPNAKRQRKLFSETETLQYIKMIVEMRPASLFSLHNGSKTPFDVAKKTDFRKIAHFLQVSMKQNKYILSNENRNMNAVHMKHHSVPLSNPSSQSPCSVTFNDELYINMPHTNSLSHSKSKYTKSKSKKKVKIGKVTEYTESDISDHSLDYAMKLNRRQTVATSPHLKTRKANGNKGHKVKRKQHDYSKSAVLTGLTPLHNCLFNETGHHSVPNAVPKIPYIDDHDAPSDTPSVKQWNSVDFIFKMQNDGTFDEQSPRSPYYVVDDSTIDGYSNAFDEIVLRNKGIKDTQSEMNVPPHVSKQRDLESRIKALEDQNSALKSDVRFLRKSMYDLTNNVELIMQNIKKQ